MALAETNTVANIIAIASAEVGYREGRDASGNWINSEKYAGQVPGLAWANGYAWCAVFASWVLYKAGALGRLQPTASVINFLQQGKNLGRFTEYPVVGAIVIYGTSDHTGIVIGYDNDYISVVEGNTNDDGSAEGNGVYLKRRLRRDPWVTGYVIPFPNSYADSPDPTWSGKWLGTGKPAAPTPVPPTPVVVAKVFTISLSAVRRAALLDPARGQGGTTPGCADDVRAVETLLVRERRLDPRYADDGSYGSATIDAYRGWQQHLGYRGSDADGVPGTVSLSKLIAAHGHGQYNLGA